MIIDTTYFQSPPLYIPNSVNGVNYRTDSTMPTNVENLQAVIDRVEYDLLFNALGYAQYTEIMNQFKPDGTWKDDALQKWKDLVDGKEEWKGLRYTIGINKVSLIAYYVYYQFLAKSRQYFTTTGLVVSRGENSDRVNPTEELTEKWNEFLCMYQGGYNFRYLNYWNPIFFEWNGYPVYEEKTDGVSFLKFLNDNTDIYDNSYFKMYEYKNSLGI